MNNLKSARKAKHLTQTEVAKYIGLSQSAYSDWERGISNIDSTSLARLAGLYEVSTDYLLGKSAGAATGYIRVPVLGRVAAGIPIDAIEETIDWEDVPEALAEGCELFGLKVKGNSMEPKISDGDVVIVRQCEDVETGNIAVVLINGEEATVKRIKKRPDGVMLVPTNPEYEPFYYSNEEIERLPVRIIGRVVELRAKL